jgi:FixJ family two-component response regulator
MIFIIDNDTSARNALLRLLQAARFDAQAFPLVEIFQKHGSLINNVDCIILDLHLTGINGFDLMEKLKSEGFHKPVICLASFDDARSRERARELGAVAYFTKPVDDQALIDATTWVILTERKTKT